MDGTLGRVGGRRKAMLGELAKVDLASPAKAQVKALSYASSKQVLEPSALRPPTDDRHLVLQKWVQAALNVALGMRLKINGILQGDTRAALMRFQKDQGLTAHGFLDEKTLMALELCVGVPAPRDGTHEGVRRLLKTDSDRMPVKPAPPPRDERGVGEQPAKKSPEVEPADPEAALRLQAHAFLQREALEAVARVAFERPFVEQQLARLGRAGAPALHAEMLAWYGRAQSVSEPPTWLSRLRDSARERPQEAAETVRHAWIREHG